MAVPKRKTSKSRKRKRRTHYKISAPTLTECSHCGEPKLPHNLCMNCGYYKGKQILEIKK
ncbi:MAG: 50S ribosomal protein L32 [Candidatus Cloacimonadota bacterium]|nr:MAG: 50S ribosomal protein L32 [Candidatus Cloacimonadota bacterium]